jgi:hypothetical protein
VVVGKGVVTVIGKDVVVVVSKKVVEKGVVVEVSGNEEEEDVTVPHTP